jgi:hypothetical protein
MAKPVLAKQHLKTWSAADCATQTDYTAIPTLKPYHFLIWSVAEIIRYFGL